VTRYEKIVKKLDGIHEDDLRICTARFCACTGCCGSVGAKKITERELLLYKCGSMQKTISDMNNTIKPFCAENT